MSEAAAASTTRPGVTLTAVPALPRGVRVRLCPVREAHFLLAPERAVRLDPVGAAVLSEVDGARPFSEIVERLARRFNAPPQQIAQDAGAFLREMADRRMLEIRP